MQTANFEDITREQAEAMLAKNPMNRRLSATRVRIMARDMVGGRWGPNGEPIIIDNQGNLVSGQHRLSAIVQSGLKSVQMLVVRGVPPDSRWTVDQGRPRSAADALEMGGVSETPKTLAAAARFAMAYERGDIHKRSQVAGSSNSEVLAWIGDHPEIDASTAFVSGLNVPRGTFPKGAMAGLHYVFSRLDPIGATSFWLGVAEGQGLEAGDARLALRERLIESATSRTKRLPFRGKLAMAIKAWNAYRAKQPVRLSLQKREDMPIAA